MGGGIHMNCVKKIAKILDYLDSKERKQTKFKLKEFTENCYLVFLKESNSRYGLKTKGYW